MKSFLAAGAIALTTLICTAAYADNFAGGSYARVRESSSPFDGSNNGYKLFAGAYNRTAGLEAGWVNFGHLGGNGPHADAWTSALMIGFPVDSINVFGKAGLAVTRVGATPTTGEAKKYRFYYGGGVRLGGQKGFGIRAEYERYRLNTDHTVLLSAGLEYRF